ncbi:universal stress protein [Marinobacter sp. OP 3.4]|uniref:universal stress protein n=1 Tax=Marinobacter sp. OP 3.4 TaxID=3076501 RepID=UPI002E226A49
MLSHLILTVDYSDNWEQAIKQLPPLLERLRTRRLTLTYVVEPHTRKHIRDSDSAVESKLRDLARQYAEHWGVDTDYEVRHGFVASCVLELARHHKADGVICCSTHHSAGRELFRGNITMNLARMTRRPLLILPVEAQPSSPQSPVFLATDGSENARRCEELFQMLTSDGQEGRVVWVRPDDAPPEADEVDRLVHDIANSKASVHARILTGHPSRELLALIRDSQPALTLIGKRGSTPEDQFPLGHTAETVVRESRHPVLLVP